MHRATNSHHCWENQGALGCTRTKNLAVKIRDFHFMKIRVIPQVSQIGEKEP